MQICKKKIRVQVASHYYCLMEPASDTASHSQEQQAVAGPIPLYVGVGELQLFVTTKLSAFDLVENRGGPKFVEFFKENTILNPLCLSVCMYTNKRVYSI